MLSKIETIIKQNIEKKIICTIVNFKIMQTIINSIIKFRFIIKYTKINILNKLVF